MKNLYCRKILVLFVLIGVIFTQPLALAADDDDRKSSIDAVIVLDQSQSMSRANARFPNDPENYRQDAAQMLIGMCDMNHSRVALIPFSGTIERYGDNDFVDISDYSVRKAKMEAIEEQRKANLGGDTDLGNALSMAVKLLLERSDTRNNPMIIVLSDGKNEIDRNKNSGHYNNKTVYQWNESANAFESALITGYTSKDADTLRDKAAEVAAQNGIPIYTIPLLSSAPDANLEELKILRDTLQAMADYTDATCTPINSANADQLPRVFGEMLATQIGSNLLEDIRPVPVEGHPGRYEVSLPILNQSVVEANIYVPMGGIVENSLTLYDASGKDLSRGGKDVSRLPSKNFVLYKIHTPRTLGDWKLVFDLKDPAGNATDISFSLLYNYDIALKTRIGSQFSNMLDAGVGLDLSKIDTLYITSSFYTISESNSDGSEPSRDINLYKIRDVVEEGDEWETIRGTYSLVDEFGKSVFTGQMVSDEVSQFSAQIDLATAAMNPEGYNDLKAGDYELKIVADGAGLHRENSIPITLANTPPVSSLPSLETIVTVEDPEDAQTNESRLVEVRLNDFVKDKDNGKLMFDLQPKDNATTSIIDMRVVYQDDGSAVAQGYTVVNPAGGMISGIANYSLTATDVPDGDKISLDFTVTVHSKTGEILDGFECPTTTTGISATGEVEKNSPVTFAMELHNKAGNPDTTGAIRGFVGTIYIFSAGNTSTYIDKISMSLNDAGTKLVGVYQTGNTKADMIARCTYSYNGKEAPSEDIAFSIFNSAPVTLQKVWESVPATITYEPLPAFLSFLEQPTSLETRTLEGSDLFADSDNEAGLDILDPVLISSDKNTAPSSVMNYTRSGDTFTLLPAGSGTVSLTITAKDGDGETAQATWSLSVVSLVQKWAVIGTIALIVLIALVALIVLVVHLRKPKFNPKYGIQVKKNASLYSDQTTGFLPTRKSLPLSHFVDMTLAEEHGVTFAALNNLLLQPTHSLAGDVKVNSVNQVADYEVRLDDEPVGKKPMDWQLDHQLTIRAQQSSNKLVFQLAQISDDIGYVSPLGSSDPFGGEANTGFSDFAAPFGGGSQPNKSEDIFGGGGDMPF